MQKQGLKITTKAFETVLGYLPRNVGEAVTRHLLRTRTSAKMLSEIRLRSHGACAMVLRGENVEIDVEIDTGDIKETFLRVSGGAIFAHRDDICRGFIALPCGIRVGVVGHARYERGSVIGVSEISSLVFRIPSGECSFGHSLYGGWLMSSGGMLICSRAGEGKTTAIRTLAGLIGSGERPRRVAVVDERSEFDPSEYVGAHVDVLRGYRRALGVDIAVRTLSAEVLIVDEISSLEDARAMMSALGAGVTVIATAHGASLDDAMRRDYIRELVLGGLFESVCVIERRAGDFSYRIEKIDNAVCEKLHGMGDI